MNTLPHSKMQSLLVWRDSVAAGDDVDAPHQIKLSVEGSASVAHAVAKATSANYLPTIAGGRATWIVEAGSLPLAVVAQQWPEPRYLVPPTQPVAQFIANSAGCQIYFKYWCQADPNTVFESLKNGNPLPNKYS